MPGQEFDHKDYDPVRERDEALKFAGIEGKKILDVGTGAGWLAIRAAKDFGCKVTTLDISEEKIAAAIENAKKETAEEITFVLGDATKMPFDDKSFDAAITFNALHHSGKKFNSILDEMLRVSKDKVIVTEITREGAEIFDKHIRPNENHGSLVVDHNMISDILSKKGRLKTLERKLMNTFVCEKP